MDFVKCRITRMGRLALGIGLTVGLAVGPGIAGGEVSEGASVNGWPMFSGPHGNFVPNCYGVELVKRPKEARLQWVSEEDEIGIAKGPYHVEQILEWGASPHPGGRASPIVAEGTVFVSYCRPVGPPYATDRIRILGTKAGKPKSWWDIWGIEAHDVLVAIDAETGRTKWKAVEERAGVRMPGLKRGGWGVSPAYSNGRVYGMGTTANLYCYDADSGKKLWKRGLGVTHMQAMAAKKKALETKRFAELGGWLSSLVVAEGVLVVPTFHEEPRGLTGVDPETGKILWRQSKVLSPFSTPAVANQDGHDYLLVNSGRGELRMVEPSSGEILWRVDDVGPFLGPLAPSSTHVMVTGRSHCWWLANPTARSCRESSRLKSLMWMGGSICGRDGGQLSATTF